MDSQVKSKVHPDIETFYKSFGVIENILVGENHVTYKGQTYRIEDTVALAETLIQQKGLNLKVSYSKILRYIIIEVK